MDFNVNRVVFRKIFVLPALVILGIILGLKEYAGYENMVAEWISRRLGVVLITSMPSWLAYDQNIDFSSFIELGIVSNVFKG